jgi:hypothetical protein
MSATNNTPKRIKLSRATTMTTGYQGRGIPSRSREVPAGTEVLYHKVITNDGTVYHTVVWTDPQGVRWEANVRRSKEEEAAAQAAFKQASA